MQLAVPLKLAGRVSTMPVLMCRESRTCCCKGDVWHRMHALQLCTRDAIQCNAMQFRPDYKKLGVLKQQFPEVPILALTATATERVCRDVQEILRIEGCETFRSSMNRANLFYEVRGLPALAGSRRTLLQHDS